MNTCFLTPLTLSLPCFPHPKQIDNARHDSSISISRKRSEAIGVELARAEAFFLDCFAIDKIVRHIVAGIEYFSQKGATPDELKFDVISTGPNDATKSHNWSGLTRVPNEEIESISRPMEGSVTVNVGDKTCRYDFNRWCIGYSMTLSLDDDENTMQSYPLIDTGFGYGDATIDFTEPGSLKIVEAGFVRNEDPENSTNPFPEEGHASNVRMKPEGDISELQWKYSSWSTNVS